MLTWQDELPTAAKGSPPMLRRFLQRLPLVDRGHWHTMAALRFDHMPDQARLRQALRRVIAHHDAGAPGLAGWRDLAPDVADLGHLPFFLRAGALREQADRLAASVAFPARAGDALLVRLADGDVRLLWILHQTAADASSWRILLEDLGRAYAHPCEQLPPAALQAAYAGWAGLHAGVRSLPARVPRMRIPRAMPAGDPPDTGLEYDTRTLTLVLPHREWRRIRALLGCQPAPDTQAVLLTVVALALRGWTGAAEVAFDVQTPGRALCAGPDFSRTVGWLDAYAPLHAAAGGTPAEVLARIRRDWRRLQADGPSFVHACNEAENRVGDPFGAHPDQPLLVSFLGDLDALTLPRGWSAQEIAAPYRAPTNPRTHEIELDAVRRGGTLVLQLRFAASVLRPRGARSLLRHMRRAWLDLSASLQAEAGSARHCA